MKKTFFTIILIVSIISLFPSVCNSTSLDEELLKSLNKDLPSLDMTIYNHRIFAMLDSVESIYFAEDYISRFELVSKISSLSQKSSYNRYSSSGNILDSVYYGNLISNMNLMNINNNELIKYGVAISRTQLKKFPTEDKAFSSTTSPYDRFLETTLYVGEPISIFYESKDSKYLFVAMYNYEGWVKKEDIAFCDKATMKSYLEMEDFLTIINPVVNTQESNIRLDMGCTLKIIKDNQNNFEVNIPSKNNNGDLVFITDTVLKTDAVLGCLEYNISNILTQSFKFIGEPYGWGGDNDARDCSSFIMDIYRSFGISLPRNTDQQENSLGIIIDLNNKENYDILIPGMPMYMNGHVVLYIGEYNNTKYIIHDTPGFYQNGSYQNANGVTITTLYITNSKGIEYSDLIYKAIFIK